MAATLGEILGIMRDAGIAKPLRFAAVHADGERLRCYRWASDGRPPSLYWRREAAGPHRRLGAFRHRRRLAVGAGRIGADARPRRRERIEPFAVEAARARGLAA